MEMDGDALEAVKVLHGLQCDGRELRVSVAHGPKSRFGGTVGGKPGASSTSATALLPGAEPPTQGNP
jgi:hypothetical protein